MAMENEAGETGEQGLKKASQLIFSTMCRNRGGDQTLRMFLTVAKIVFQLKNNRLNRF